MSNERVPAGLVQVRAELEAWRRGQRRRGDRIPAPIWRRAVRAVRQYGVNPVSRALGLDYAQLKRRANGVGEPKAVSTPVFVEMEGAGAQTGLACVVELEKGTGTRMRICVREAVAVDWGKLKEAFLGA